MGDIGLNTVCIIHVYPLLLAFSNLFGKSI